MAPVTSWVESPIEHQRLVLLVPLATRSLCSRNPEIESVTCFWTGQTHWDLYVETHMIMHVKCQIAQINTKHMCWFVLIALRQTYVNIRVEHVLQKCLYLFTGLQWLGFAIGNSEKHQDDSFHRWENKWIIHAANPCHSFPWKKLYLQDFPIVSYMFFAWCWMMFLSST